jgi:cellulose synthase/poly-beta-1,6-N-acetylglucosamine synthase-like glycosyltransferase
MLLIYFLIVSVEIILFIYFSYVVLYTLLLAIAGKFKTTLRKQDNGRQNKIAVFLPSYKEDVVIMSSAKAALEQTYPGSAYDVIVIADGLQEQTVQTLQQLPLKVIPVAFEKSTKVKSLNSAMETIGDGYDIAVVLDADNIMAKDFLTLLNDYYNAGYLSVQGQRRPKNFNTRLAVLDGLSEDINNHIYRKGTCALGGSSAIVGSGFAVQYNVFKKTLSGMDSIGGFDKELEIKLLQQGIKTVYAEDAHIFDEKVEKSEVFVNQRKRWIASQYFYLRKYFSTGVKALFSGNFSLFNSTVFRYIQLPRLLNLGLLFMIALAAVFLRAYVFLPFWTWSVFFARLVLSFLLAAPARMYSRSSLSAISTLPKTFLQMLLLMFRLKGANKKFIHTPHGIETNK